MGPLEILWQLALSVLKDPKLREKITGFFKRKKKSDETTPLIHLTNTGNKAQFSIDNRKIVYKKYSLLTLNFGRFATKGKKKAKDCVKELVEEENYKLIDETAHRKLIDIKTNEEKQEIRELLSSIRDIVPAADIPIIRASLYLRKELNRNKKPVPELKEDILLRFGQRGAQISNIVTAGYFETMIIPLHKNMKADPAYDMSKFQSVYETIVSESAYAVFVHSRLNAKKLKKIICKKISVNKRYAKNYVNIHGIGKENVKKVLRVCEELEETHYGLRLEEMQPIGETINGKICLNEDFDSESLLLELE